MKSLLNFPTFQKENVFKFSITSPTFQKGQNIRFFSFEILGLKFHEQQPFVLAKRDILSVKLL